MAGLDAGPWLSSWADFDEARQRRWSVGRCWDSDLPSVLFVMLNPSVADEHKLDLTLRRCLLFARCWGFGGFEVVNLCSWIATNPRDLRGVDPLNLPRCDARLTARIDAHRCLLKDNRVVFAWGSWPTAAGSIALQARAAWVHSFCRDKGVVPLRFNSDHAFPPHPLYLRATTPLVPYKAG